MISKQAIRNFRLNTAFTLIELLLVISLVALIMALLLPSLSKARESAQAAGSLANIRQIHTPLYQYAVDNRYDMPYMRWPGPLPSQGNYHGRWSTAFWPGVLYHAGYLTSPEIFWSAKRDRSLVDLDYAKGTDPWGARAGHNAWALVGYGLVGTGHINTRPIIENLATDRPAPAKTINLVECWREDAQWSHEPKPGFFQILPWHQPLVHKPRLFTYHGRSVRSYYDGHGSASNSQDIGWDYNHPDSLYWGNYRGEWTLALDDWRYKSPWYIQWKVLMLD